MVLLKYKWIGIIIISFVFSTPFSILAQGNGDNLSFQGLDRANDVSVKALAMGGAYTAVSGDINSLFYNAAGLASLEKFQISFSSKYSDREWWENQIWMHSQNRVTLFFILGGMFMPDPKYDGLGETEMWNNNVITNPDIKILNQGKYEWSKDAADWIKDNNDFNLNNIAIAVPVDIGKQHFVAAVSYNRRYDINDYDRNDTNLDPHFGNRYDPRTGDPVKEEWPDSLVMQWGRFERERKGGLYGITAALAYQLNNALQLSVGVNTFSGNTIEHQRLDHIAEIRLYQSDARRYTLYHKSGEQIISGESEFSGTQFTFGALWQVSRIRLGLSIETPFTLKREYTLKKMNVDESEGISTEQEIGIDKVNMPLCYNFGISVQPTDNFLISLDLQKNPYSKAEFNYAKENPTHQNWVDQNIISFGMSYKVAEILQLFAGYRDVPQVFLPFGWPKKDVGPSAYSYTAGASIKLFHGSFDVAYEFRRLKYFDVYETNKNYPTETCANVLFGYTLEF